MAYVVMNELREGFLAGTELAKARCQTIRLKLFKVAANVTVTARRIWLSMSSSYLRKSRCRQILKRIQRLEPLSVWGTLILSASLSSETEPPCEG